MNNKYSKYYPFIEQNKQYFEQMLDILPTLKNHKQQFSLACYAAAFATFHNCGYFTSNVLENFFTDYAKKLHAPLPTVPPHPNSFLHVLTEGYETGGHTRVVERWINHSPNSQMHSVVILNPRYFVLLHKLQQLVRQHHGEYITFTRRNSLEKRAIKLRQLAMHYECIILHTNCQDPMATLAFGTEEFTRPVLLYNHTSHMFWLGKNIADRVLDLCQNDPLTINRRGIKSPFFLGVPSLSMTSTVADKYTLRKKLHLPLDKKIIISAGAEPKYIQIGNDSFYSLVKPLLNSNTYIYIIGIRNKSIWKQIYQQSNKHVIPLGYINFNQGYLDYIACADLFLDSYPFVGGTACIDAITSNVPVLSMSSTFPQFDYLTHTSAYCHTRHEFISKATRVLTDKNFAQSLLDELKSSLQSFQSPQAWVERLHNCLKNRPVKHCVKTDYAPITPCITDLNVLDNAIANPYFLNRSLKNFPFSPLKEALKKGIFFLRTEPFPLGFTIDIYYKNGRAFYVARWLGYKLFSIPW